jgi:hypothetical protein
VNNASTSRGQVRRLCRLRAFDRSVLRRAALSCTGRGQAREKYASVAIATLAYYGTVTVLLRADDRLVFMRQLIWAALVSICVHPTFASAQDRPFVFSLTTATDASTPHIRADYEVGLGDHMFHQQTTNGPEQRLGIHASVRRLTFVAHVGVAAATDTYQTSQHGEMLVSVFAPGASRTALAIGGGVLHEAGGVNVLLARFVAGHERTSNRVWGNLLFQKPFSGTRDALDVITSVGWAARVTPTWALGVEAIGEDLEGFWEAEEAEGGARILIGPTAHVAPPQKRWQVSVAGGPTFHPKTTGRTSGALRDLPATTAARDYAVRTTFAYRF